MEVTEMIMIFKKRVLVIILSSEIDNKVDERLVEIAPNFSFPV